MLLRMLILAALCFAIAQPKLLLPGAWAGWLGLGGPRPAAAVFVFDVSYSMEYRVGGLSRLDDSRQRALNSGAIQTLQTAYGPSWLSPATILDPRIFQLSGQISF